MNGTDDSASNDLRLFTNQCIFMRSIYEHFAILFERASDKDRERMSSICETFFGDLNHVLIEYIILQVCKISDPATDFRQNENHTIAFLIQHYKLVGHEEFGGRVTELGESIQKFRAKLLPARNKLISHADRDAILSARPLGGAAKEDWSQFWENLQEILDILHVQVSESNFFLNEVGELSDAENLLKALSYASHFSLLLQDENPVVAKRSAELATG